MRFIKAIAGILGGSSVAIAAPLDQATQKKQLESLIDAALPFAEKMLTKHGEFIPFGASMKPDGKEAMVGGDVGEEHPKSQAVIDLLRQSFRREGADEKILCCAVAYDVRVIHPSTGQKTDAVAIDLDHRDGMSVTMYYPYFIDEQKSPHIGECWASKGSSDIFSPAKKRANQTLEPTAPSGRGSS